MRKTTLIIAAMATTSLSTFALAAPQNNTNASDSKLKTTPLTEQQRFQMAAEYSKAHNGFSVLVMKGDKIVFENYSNGGSTTKATRLASGTKSFVGVMAAAAIQDGILRLDERVSDTITQWKGLPRKSEVTVRQLLHLSSGLAPAKQVLDTAPDKYQSALNLRLLFAPGTQFMYGPSHYYVFGELMKRKLASRKENPLQYLERRVLKPIGLKYAEWRHDSAGNPHLPNGAYLTAREWAKFGLFVKNGGKWNSKQIIKRELMQQLLQPGAANPGYGLTFWLNAPPHPVQTVNPFIRKASPDPNRSVLRGGAIYDQAPRDLAMAAGAGQQRLYIIPSLDMVIVRQGESNNFRDAEFLARLLHGRALEVKTRETTLTNTEDTL